MAGESAGKVAKTFSTGDLLKDLWGNNNFRYQFPQALDRTYSRSGVKNWCHLAEKFKIPRSTYDAFTGPDNISPSENMLDYLETTKPTLTVIDFMRACQSANSSEICSFFRKQITVGKVLTTDKMEALWDKAHEVIDNLLLMLDRNRLWMDVAKALEIPKKKYQTFSSNPDNKARGLFEILTIEEADKPLNVRDLKSKLENIERGDVIKLLDEEKTISESSLLREVPGTLYNIEKRLNSHDVESVYKLAKLYKAVNGCFKDRNPDINLELLFLPEDSCCSPTKSLIEHVIKAHPEHHDPTVKDLIVHLLEINRDPENLIEGYLTEGGKKELNRIKVEYKMTNLRLTSTRIERQRTPTQNEDAVGRSIEETATDPPANVEHQPSNDVPDPAELRRRRLVYQYVQAE